MKLSEFSSHSIDRFLFCCVLGKSHSAAWMVSPTQSTKSSFVEIGVPKCIPSEFTVLKDCKVADVRERLLVLRKFSELISKSWKMMNLTKKDVS